MPHYTLLIRGDTHLPWRTTEHSSANKEDVRARRLSYLNMSVSPACLKILETEDGEPETVRAAIERVNGGGR